jgi:hypothetical protein
VWVRAQAALRLPFAGRRWPRKWAIGAATTLAFEALFAALGYLLGGEVGMGISPLAVAVNFPLLGYVLGVFRGGLAGKPPELPEWERWPDLVKTGIFLALVGLGYGLVPLLMLLVGLNLLVRGGMLLSMAVALIILGLALALSILFFFPMGVARYLTEERIEAAFRPASLWAGIDRVLGEYVGVYALTVAAHVVAGVVASVPFAGPLATPLLAFYLIVVLARLFGETCGRALGLRPANPDTADHHPTPS